MPRDGSGVYTLPAGNPVVTNTVIASAWANGTMSDIAAQLNNVLTRDGLLGPTGPFKIVDGTVNAPGLAFASEVGLGMYRPAANQISWAAAGIAVMNWTLANATQSYINFGPRTAGQSQINLSNQPLGGANQGTFYLSMDASGIGRIGTSKAGTGVAASIGLQPADGGVSIVGAPSVNFILNKNGNAVENNIIGSNNNKARWLMQLGNGTAEGGSNAGSNFFINRYDDAGNYLGTPFQIVRSDGLVMIQNAARVLGAFQADGQTTLAAVNINGVVFTGTNVSVGGQLQVTGQAAFAANVLAQGGYLEVFQPSGTAGQYAVFKLRNGLGESKQIRMGPGGAVLEFINSANTQILTSMNDAGVWNSVGSFNPASDERIKHDIVPLTADAAAFASIVPIRFKRNHDPQSGEHWGFSAQNLYGAFPLAVVGSVTAVKADDTPDPAALDTTAILAQTVLMVQDLIRRITQLENA